MYFGGFAVFFFFSLKVSELSMYLQLFLRNAELLAGKTSVKKNMHRSICGA